MRACSLDHLVGGNEQLVRYREAEHPGSRGIDDQFELARLPNWQVRGLGPLEDAAGIDTGLTPCILNVGTVAHQPAHFGNFTRRICRGNRVARRQVGKLHPPTGEKRVGDNEERVGPLAYKSCEGRINLVDGAGVEDLDLQSNGARSRFHVSQNPIRIGGGRIDEHCYTSRSRHQFMQEFQLLCHQLTSDNIDTRCITPRPGEAGDEPEPDRVFVDDKDDGDRRSCRLGRQRWSRASGHRDHPNSSASQIGRQRRQSIDLILGPAVFNHYILTLDNVCRFEALTEYAHTLRHSVRRSGVEEPDHWNRLLLCTRRERPCRHCAAEQRDELAPLHVWMAPAWQEIIWRAAQRSLAVMCPACWCSPGGLLALMGSANRVLIIRTGSMSR